MSQTGMPIDQVRIQRSKGLYHVIYHSRKEPGTIAVRSFRTQEKACEYASTVTLYESEEEFWRDRSRPERRRWERRVKRRLKRTDRKSGLPARGK